MPEPVQISRDAFARTTTYRECYEPKEGESCAWCGQTRGIVGGKRRLFRYGTAHDSARGGQIHWTSRVGHVGFAGFCGVECWRAFTAC